MGKLGRSAYDDVGAILQGQTGVLEVTKPIKFDKFAGEVTLNGATPVSVADANVSEGAIILFTLKTPHGTVGAYPAIKTLTPGTGFTVAGTALDTSDYNYLILK